MGVTTIKNFFLLLIIFLLLLTCGCDDSNPNKELDDYITKRTNIIENSPSTAIMIIDDGKIVFEKCYGYSNVETMEKATPETNYRLASITKMFTAMCAIILHDRGELDYDEKLSDILDDFPDYGKNITVRHLLTHTSGLRDYYDLTYLLEEKFNEENQLLDSDVYEIVKLADSTYFTPGGAFKYSDTGYTVLGRVIEKKSGIKLAKFMEENIFIPLEMNNTVAYDKELNQNIPNRAYGAESDGVKYINHDQSYSSAVLGDGGVYTSLNDMYKWDQALYGDVLVSRESLEEAYTPPKVLNKQWENYNSGWFFLKNDSGNLEMSHDGSTQGFSTYYIRLPEKKKSMIILTNRDYNPEPYKIENIVRSNYGF